MIPDNLGALLTESSRRYPDRLAIVFGSKKIIYRDLEESVNHIAAGLAHLGIRNGDKVAVFLDNCPDFVSGYYAIMKVGAVAVPINYMFKAEEVRFILQDSRAVCLITSKPSSAMAEELRRGVPGLGQVITNINAIKRLGIDHSIFNSAKPSDLAVILYTSGTTGHPKGAMLTHRNLISNALDSSQAIRLSCRDSVICILPLFHSFAATVCMNLPLLIGAKIVIMKSVRPFRRVIRVIRKNRVTIFVGIPSIFNILKDIKLPKIFNTPLIKLFNPVRLCISGAAALPAETLESFEKRFRIILLEGYGLTEASPVVTLNPLKGKRNPGSIGIRLSKNILLKVADEKGREVKNGEVGELLVRGPNVMQGYLHQDEANRETLKDGWLYTGDMARSDQDGYFYIVGRKKEMINVRGLNVYPREIEEVLYQNPKVKEAAVIGIPDAHRGEVPKGFIVLKEGISATEHEFIQYLREHLAGYKIPKTIEFRQDLPRNATGKILKRILQDEENKR